MASKYIKPLNGNSRLQSGLGRVVDVYQGSADSLVMAEVVKVNYIYNTVDVVTVHNSERLIQTSGTKGKFSARLPVQFGGALSNGNSYGSVIPVNVGDDVLIGFIDQDKTAPIVLGIYKSSDISSSLAPTDKVAGNPEDPSLFNNSFDSFTLFPSQTYRDVDGHGNVEITLPGKSFMKLSSETVGGGRMTDDNFDYEDLTRYRLRDRNVEPENTGIPQTMYRHQGDNSPFITTMLFDDDGSTVISRLHKGNEERSDIQIDPDGNPKFRYQGDSRVKNDNDSTNWSEVGIRDGVPTLATNKHTVYLDDTDGLMVDGKKISDYLSEGGGVPSEELEQIKEDIEQLQSDLDGITSTDISSLQQSVKTVNDYINKTVKPNMELINNVGSEISRLSNTVNSNDATLNSLTTQFADAQGDYDSLSARFAAIEGSANRLEATAKELTDTHTDAEGNTYSNLSERLDQMTSDLATIETSIKDYSSLLAKVSSLDTRISEATDNISNVNHKLDSILTADVTKQANAYVVAITPKGNLNLRSGNSTTLEARLYKYGYDFTDKVDAKGFIWTRTSADTKADTTWNNQHKTGSKTLVLTDSDIDSAATFDCSVTVSGNIIS